MIEDKSPVNDVIKAIPIPDANSPMTVLSSSGVYPSMLVNVDVRTIKKPTNVPTMPIDSTASEKYQRGSIELFLGAVSLNCKLYACSSNTDTASHEDSQYPVNLF